MSKPPDSDSCSSLRVGQPAVRYVPDVRCCPSHTHRPARCAAGRGRIRALGLPHDLLEAAQGVRRIRADRVAHVVRRRRDGDHRDGPADLAEHRRRPAPRAHRAAPRDGLDTPDAQLGQLRLGRHQRPRHRDLPRLLHRPPRDHGHRRVRIARGTDGRPARRLRAGRGRGRDPDGLLRPAALDRAAARRHMEPLRPRQAPGAARRRGQPRRRDVRAVRARRPRRGRVLDASRQRRAVGRRRPSGSWCSAPAWSPPCR